MLEIELIAQAGHLMAGRAARDIASGLEAGVAIGWLSDADSAALMRAYALCWKVQMVARLISEKPFEPDRIGEGGVAFLLRETNEESLEMLETRLGEICADAPGLSMRASRARQRRSDPWTATRWTPRA